MTGVLPDVGVGQVFSKAVFHIIGSKKQLSTHEESLKTMGGLGMRLHPILPLDYWMPLKV